MNEQQILIKIVDASGAVRLEAAGETHSELVWYGSYEPGDKIVIQATEKSYVKIQIDTLLSPATVYLTGDFVFEVPFGRAKEAYPQEAFALQGHQITAEYVEKSSTRRNLSENSLDIRGETNAYPHCTASVETRGESVFAGRNTIDGLLITSGHGFWPHTSWGEGEDPDAHITIWFGKTVSVDEVQIFLRSDFPHDNYWQSAALAFSDGYELPISLNKTGECQSFRLTESHQTEWVRLKDLRKDPTDPSPFPALTQWRVYGRDI